MKLYKLNDGMFTYVPGFWSWKGFNSTVRTLMLIVCVLEAAWIQVGAIEGVKGWQWATFELGD
mgnify:CR=1 FL=1